jgi:hypothetical protein
MADVKKLPPKMALKSIFDFPNTVVLSDKELPAIKDWKVGEKYTIELEVEQTSMRKKEDGSMCAEFKINSASSEDETDEDDDESELKKGGKVKKMNDGGKVEAPDTGGKTSSKATSTKATPKSDLKRLNEYDMW